MVDDAATPTTTETRRPVDFGYEAAPRALDRTYSRYIRGLKVILPATAALIVIVVFAWPQVQLREQLPDPDTLRIKPEDTADLTVLGVRYVGVDAQDRPYTVTAASTRQTTTGSDEVVLEMPEADMSLRDGRRVELKAENGVFDREHRALTLSGKVVFTHDGGFEIATDRASVDFREGEATGNERVSLRAPDGTGSGDGFRILEDGRRVLLTGKSSLQLNARPRGDGT